MLSCDTALGEGREPQTALRYNKSKAATIRQRAIERHGGVAVDGDDVHIGSKHVLELILNHGPPEVAVELLADSVPFFFFLSCEREHQLEREMRD